MITIDQLDKNLNDMLEGWLTKFEPLYISVYQERVDMEERIFGKGNKGGSNRNGDKLPTTAYSTKPIYVSPKDLRNAPSQFKKGKRGTPINSLYFPGGYAQIKTQTTAVKPLQLTGNLIGSWIGTPLSEDGLTASIEIGSDQKDKIKGLEFGNGDKFKGYGVIFKPSKEEEQAMLDYQGELIVEQINKQFNG
jgi:hypothetical protein